MLYQDRPECYLNQLFERTRGEPLQEVLRQIPAEIGKIRIFEKKTRQGMSWIDWKMRWNQDMRVRKTGNDGEDMIQLIFFLNHGMNWEVEGKEKQIYMDAGECCIYRDTKASSTGDYQGGAELMFKNIQIPAGIFCEWMEEVLDDRGRRKTQQVLQELRKTMITPEMYRVIRELETMDQYKNGLSSLYLEGKIIELLTVFLDAVMPSLSGPEKKRQLSKTDLEILLGIKERIDRDSADVPGIAQLAREVHVSPSKLSKGFKELTGLSLHAYVIDRRLSHAAKLLEEGEMNVSEAAMCSGYSNMSHFSAAFQKKYGVLPREYPDRKC